MAKFTKNDIVKQYFSLLSKISSAQKDINGREGSVSPEYNNSIVKIFAVLILLGYEYQEKGPNIVIQYDDIDYRIEKEALLKYVNLKEIKAKKNNEEVKENIDPIPAPTPEKKKPFSKKPEKIKEPENKVVETVKQEKLLVSEPENLEIPVNKEEASLLKKEIAPFEEISNTENQKEEYVVTPEEESNNSEVMNSDDAFPDLNEAIISKLTEATPKNLLESTETVKEETADKDENPLPEVKIEEGNSIISEKEPSLSEESRELEESVKLEETLLEDPLFEGTNLMDKIFEADSSVIFVPEMAEESETWLDKAYRNLAKDNHDFKQNENFIYNRHIIRLKTKDGLEKTVKFLVYPLEYKNNKIPTSILVISDFYGRYKYSYSEKRKIVEITIDDMDFMVSGKWLDGEFDSIISPTSEVREGSVVSDVNKFHTSGVYPKHFGKRIKKDNVSIDVFPVSNQNNRYGIVPCVALVKSNDEMKSFITGEEGRLMIPTHGKLYSYDTYWMGDGFHVTES